MHRQIKLLLTTIILLSTVGISTAQTRTYSPTSRYGIGEMNYRGFGRNEAMGGTGIGVQTPRHLNSLNPASYSAIDSLNFFFEVGVSGNSNTLSHNDQSQTFSDIYFDYFAIGFPVSPRVRTSFGVKPVSQAGYQFEIIQSPQDNPVLQSAIGTGNISSAYGGVGIKISDDLNLGVHASYWFGNIKHTSFSEFLGDNIRVHGLQNHHQINSFLFDFGVQYNVNEQLTLGAVFRPRTPMRGKTSTTLATGRQYQLDGSLFFNSDTISSSTLRWNNNEFEMPMNLGVGASYRFNERFLLAMDYSTQRWSSANFPDDISQTVNTNMLSLGAELVPNERTATRYFQRVRYRAGLRYYEDYLQYNNNQITDFGMTFGLGLPVGRTFTSINLGFEYGMRGTSDSNDLSETYTRFTLNFTMQEFWFRQRRFD
ncbi:PorV/PorQ family protein [Alkalitalea saponilacus]|uniref:Long-chain fatty acid transport protein n=1 Tax=Alkalitalea saponilacus TaxID=889453 RepID=A0A1T5HR32_9BACT|nr:hypothetical protein [Alkalitalea saponilacus]ASB48385.1 hypothetical protein CDL62_04135 [Alkalitalea saponilacus]SKC23156.1 hypothetical protein SAMN03080601_02673 [Alkalitalea saponilacus]